MSMKTLWIIDAGLVCTCLWGKGKSGLILGIIMLVLYLITAFITLFGLMALTVDRELLWYIHPALIIPRRILHSGAGEETSRSNLQRSR